MKVKETKSEFGSGFIYCLYLFSLHFNTHVAERVLQYASVMKKSKEERALILCDNPDSSHNYGWNSKAKWWFENIVPVWGTEEKALSHEIEMWANGASDHLYDIKTPKSIRQQKIKSIVKKLQDKALEMGHGFNNEKTYTIEDFHDLRKMTEDIMVLVDKELGLYPIEATWK
jgi:hypothetical protein